MGIGTGGERMIRWGLRAGGGRMNGDGDEGDND